jgi:hypothetical protein
MRISISEMANCFGRVMPRFVAASVMASRVAGASSRSPPTRVVSIWLVAGVMTVTWFRLGSKSAQQARGVAGAEDDVADADRLEDFLERGHGDVGAVILRFLAGLELEAVAVRAVGLQDERTDAAAGVVGVVGVNVAQHAQPVGAREAGKPEGLVETAIVLDAEIGREDDADACAQFLETGHRRGRPGARQQRRRPLGLSRERDEEDGEQERGASHQSAGASSRIEPN